MRYYVEAAEIGSVIKSRAYYNANKHEHVEHCLIFVADSYNKRSAAEYLKIVPPEEGSDLCHRFVMHGRAVCNARKPECEKCCLSDICRYAREEASNV